MPPSHLTSELCPKSLLSLPLHPHPTLMTMPRDMSDVAVGAHVNTPTVGLGADSYTVLRGKPTAA